MTQRIVIKTKMTEAKSQPRRIETVGYQYHWRRIISAVCVASFGATALSYGVFTSVYAEEEQVNISAPSNAAVSTYEVTQTESEVADRKDVDGYTPSVDELITDTVDTTQMTGETAMLAETTPQVVLEDQIPIEPSIAAEETEQSSQKQFAADAQVASVALNAKVDTSHISRAVLTTGIEDREPINVLKHLVEPNRFQEKLYFFTEIKGLQGEVVQHLWFHQDQLMADITLPVSTPRYRTYSSKNIMPSQTGEWRVEVITQGGQLLAQKSFRILAKAP
ncbi:DUF2914 domain-containing protein [Pseudoalteromonas luteoviolacea]|uniref:DUF2914 domain-containing protein n=1 Tax=Pseudoalteromonas luteoviolacea S4054 TaxID=1129367 RepID=A0A0F6AHS8_9GAMM|nr:DUF2914 domain-containing protein [Pseudoalteromonas luteoviolacea]AOT09983.1 hypothetical protein S4054249_20145 [Pseudoalteromonas luteoviolacea]AOT14894.1 hypothetical protein S40542_20115 [Pseudoalteromonas luteoviolacea]AOT19810.1 hypothetical protein S4054_20120 [Pseudoalteromonas luteoviolacea]KKE84939.1 hypothetical protein N479_07530 [Pseudoalteromonas luteoviolacea S4054]KZN72556.1 hypothetical protein N481_15120 [Pseudoalteromonas luteoviolacea S4047-1]